MNRRLLAALLLLTLPACTCSGSSGVLKTICDAAYTATHPTTPAPGPVNPDNGAPHPPPDDGNPTTPPDAGSPGAGVDAPVGFDLAAVRWVHGGGANIASWPILATLGAVEIKLPKVCSSGVSWPAGWPKLGDKAVQANHVVIAKIDGRWTGGAWEALNVGAANTCRPLEVLTKPDPAHPEWGPFAQVERDPFWTWRPKSGEKIAFLVTSWIRSGVAQPVGRSEVRWATWP